MLWDDLWFSLSQDTSSCLLVCWQDVMWLSNPAKNSSASYSPKRLRVMRWRPRHLYTQSATFRNMCLSAFPVTWRRPKDQSTTHDSSCDLFTCHFCHSSLVLCWEGHIWACFCVQVELFCKLNIISCFFGWCRCSAWLPFWLDLGSFWELDMEVAQLHGRLHYC